MDNQTHPNTVQPMPQAPVTPSTNWLKILLLILSGLIVAAGSVFAGIQIGKNQITNQQSITEQPTIFPTQTYIQVSSTITPTPILPKVINATILPIPTLSLTSACNSKPNSLFPTPNPEALKVCQVIELRARDLLQASYNLHYLLKEIQNGQIKSSGPHNKLNSLSGELIELWLNIVGYGLGTDPYTGIQIMLGTSSFKEAAGSPSYGLGGYTGIGMPRLYNRFLENSSLSAQELQRRETNFLLLVQPYSNPSQFPFRDFEDRAYNSYRENRLLTSPQYTADLKLIDEWLTKLEKSLLQIPTFLGS